jgi:dipeptidyl aminopeptidase/acylaminoacyl peptidase
VFDKRITIAVAVIAAFSCIRVGAPAAADEARLVPMRDFFRNPRKTAFELSPDGSHVAFLKPWKRRLNVHVQKIGSETGTRITAAVHRDIAGYAWVSSERLVYVQDRGGDENFHLYAVDRDGGNPVDLTPFEGVRVGIVDRLEDDDHHLLIEMNRRDPRFFDVFRIDIRSGELQLAARNPGDISGWMTDNRGRLRVALRSDGLNTSLLHRRTENQPFETVVTTNFRDSLRPLFFTFDNAHLYVSSNIDRDRAAVYRYDPEKAEFLELIFEHPEVDVAGLLRSKRRRVVTGVSFVTDRRRQHFFDEQRRRLQQTLEEKLPGREVVIASRSRDEARFLVRTYSDRSMGAYYFYERGSERFFKLADVSPWIDAAEMAPMHPVAYISRDGLTIHGYLTLPPGGPKAPPAVILPHGGPWVRDTWGFDPQVQFLANRGLAVLQMNFRGSTGYGKAFWQAGFKQWGRRMQDDVTDGVGWLKLLGVVDPDRIGIYGASYGGYAVLAGLAFTPDLYRCGVDYVGVSNLFTLLETLPEYWELGRRRLYEMIGHPENDRELLRAVSPVYHADRIRAPLFVAQGANDPRVKKAESDQIVAALRRHGIPVRYMVKENEGHGFRNEENRFDFYRAMERFLAEHLGSRKEAGGEDPQRRNEN